MSPNHPILKTCRSWWFGAAIALFAVFVGGWGSLYSGEIRNAFPFVGPPYGGIAGFALAFWSLLTLIAVGTFGRFRAVELARNQAQSELTGKTAELQKKVTELEDLLRTQPPSDFLHLAREIFRQAQPSLDRAVASHWASTTDEISREQLAQSVRVLLHYIIVLARKFERSKRRYGANIMLFVSNESTAGREDILPVLRFGHPDSGLSHLKGVLILEASLSTSSDNVPSSGRDTQWKPEPDPKLPIFALPVPQEPGPSNRSRALPGGPRALLTGEVEFFPAAGKVREWCLRNGDFPPSVCSEVGEYFEGDSGGAIQSFVSVPLLHPKTRTPNAVLNLHRDEEGMLREKQPAEQFLAVVQPLLSILERLLARWLEVPTTEETSHA